MNYRNRKQQVGGGGGFAIWSELVHFLKTVQFYKTVHYTVHCLKTGKFTVITFVWKCLHNSVWKCLHNSVWKLFTTLSKNWKLSSSFNDSNTLSENLGSIYRYSILSENDSSDTVWKLGSTLSETYSLHCLKGYHFILYILPSSVHASENCPLHTFWKKLR